MVDFHVRWQTRRLITETCWKRTAEITHTHSKLLPCRAKVCYRPKEDLARKQAGRPRMGLNWSPFQGAPCPPNRAAQERAVETAQKVLLPHTTHHSRVQGHYQEMTDNLPSSICHNSKNTEAAEANGTLPSPHTAPREPARVRRTQEPFTFQLCATVPQFTL